MSINTVHPLTNSSSPKHPNKTLGVAAILTIASIIGWLVYNNYKKNTTANTSKQKTVLNDTTIKTQHHKPTEKDTEFRNNWKNYIQIENGDQTIGHKPGEAIKFIIYVSNKTSYLINQVVIAAPFIKKNGSIAQEKQLLYIIDLFHNSSFPLPLERN